jgi:NAD(P)-dependent dehydrogenase (short-subunit alcohol dehydrogenase family)
VDEFIESNHFFSVEAAGGKCLPCLVDIQNEDQVEKAVEETVKKFGGIDILVNNASAISLTGTLQTPIKRYDLMNRVNARGTYLWLAYLFCKPPSFRGY